uniref:Dehydrin n=1 Tax=Tripolium pannonicum TaxID=74787 RepID=Q84SA2_TRIPM|nr:dehydrin [Tripolium pannonicum] [Tripolium pannonicum subsp. tripolium]
MGSGGGYEKGKHGGIQNPLRSTDHEMGNKGTNIHSTTGGHGIGSTGTTMGSGGGQGYEEGKHGATGGILHRSGSGSSSSSEDDGEGGRRKKKGVIGKIKEKLPGGQQGSDEQSRLQAPATHVGAGGGGHGYQGEEVPEMMGLMNKIKDKLPGGNH